MSIRLYRGSLDSLMIESCINEIEADKESKHLVIIPEHYSHEMEGMMVERFGVIGINNISVVTPHRLAVNCLSAVSQNYLSESGKEMMIVRAVKDYEANEDADKKLCAIMNQSSFADNMMTLISELKRRAMSPQLLCDAASIIDGERLSDKLRAAAYIYERYEKLVSESEYSDMEDNVDRLAQKVMCEDLSIPDNKRVIDENTRVWFMRFEEYLPQHIKLISAMSERADKGSAKEITVCVNYLCPGDKEYYAGEADIYELMSASYNRLSRFMSEERFFETVRQKNRSEDIELMLRSIAVPEKCDKAAENVVIFESINPHGEVDFIAEEIGRLIRESEAEFEKKVQEAEAKAYEQGEEAVLTEVEAPLRYRDIGILFGSATDYTHVLDAVFNEHKIPYFADERIIMSEHPIAVQILSVFDIYENDWNYDSVFRYLNAGFIYSEQRDEQGRVVYKNALTPDELSRLDNYVCRYGIRGKHRWLDMERWDDAGEVFARTWKDMDEEQIKATSAYRDCEAVNAILKKVRRPFEGFLEDGANAVKDVSEHADAVIDFLERIYIYQGLKSLVTHFENNSTESKAHTIAHQFSQIWNSILEVIEQARITMQGLEMTFAEFGSYIRAGLSKCEISTIPSSLDAVYTGSVERSTSAGVKYLFVAGAVSGTYPSSLNFDGYFSDFERDAMKGSLDLAPTKDEQYAKQRFQMYKALRAASDKVYITYPAKNSLGDSYKQSSFVTNVKEYFSSVPYSNEFNIDSLDEKNITSKAAAKRNLLHNCASPIAKLPPVWRRVFDYFRMSGEYDTELEMIGRASSFYTDKPRLSEESAHMLYDREIDGEYGRSYSASSINTYAYCPMKYFLNNGLRLKEERGSDLRGDEVGSYIHKIIQVLCEEIANEAKENPSKDWESLDEEAVCEKVSTIIKETKDKLPEEIYDYRMRMRVMDRIEETVKRSAVNVLNSVKMGGFKIKETELKLDNMKIAENVYINGVVDRIDEYKGETGNYFRIIDYKSGRTEYDEKSMLNGIDMQLMIYAIAVENYYKGIGADFGLGGVYYQHTRNDFMKKSMENENVFEKERRESMYLDGMTYLPSDADEAQELINAVSKDSESDGGYLRFKLNKTKNREMGIRMPEKRSYRTQEDLVQLRSKIEENIIGIDAEIMSGNIAPHPYGTAIDKPLACDLCGFKAVCSFEREKAVRVRDDGGAKFKKEAE